MSNPTNDRIEEIVYEQGYDKGYEDCRSEMEMKVKAVLRTYLFSEKFMSPSQLAEQIGVILGK
jgi:hypothetical protein